MSLDIHLLRVVRALARHGTVTAAAAAMGLTQSTLSHALARLREHYADPLFVRSGNQLLQTPLATNLAAEAERILVDFDRVEALATSFDPRTANRTFRIHMIDVAELIFLPNLLRHWRDQGVNVGIEVVRARGAEVWQDVEAGRIDLVIGTPAVAQASLHRQRLLEERIVGIARASHPLRGRLSTESVYLRCMHCMVTPRGPIFAQVEARLAALSTNRRIQLQVPDFLSVPALIATSDLVAAVPAGLAAISPERERLHVFDLPIAETRFTVFQYWHKRFHRDPANRWLRAAIYEGAASLRQET